MVFFLKIFLVRHGQSYANRNNIFAGHYNSPLTMLGKRQAKRIGCFLAKKNIEAVFCSDLKRAFSTAKIIAGQFSKKPQMFKKRELREMKFGLWEAKKAHVFTGTMGLLEKKWRKDHFHFTPPGGENYCKLESRVKPVLRKILNSGFENILIVSHYGPTRIIPKILFGWNEKKTMVLKVPNNSVFEILFENSQPKKFRQRFF